MLLAAAGYGQTGPSPAGYGKPPGQSGYDSAGAGGYGMQSDYGADGSGRGGGRGGAGMIHHWQTKH